MNREQKRDFIKKARKRGIDEKYAKAYIQAQESLENDARINIANGDKVTIDVTKIKALKDYEKMNNEYKRFVESSDGVVFTAKVEKGNFVSLEENPKWLFWAGNLNVQGRCGV